MFDQFYHQAGDQLKLAFLEQAFENHPHLKDEFVNFYFKPAENLALTMPDPEDYILSTKELLKEELESVNLNDPDWDLYIPRDNGYVPQEVALEHMAEDQISGIIGRHLGNVQHLCEQKSFDLAFFYLISIYQGCVEAEPDDEYDLLYDAQDFMIPILEEHLQDMIPVFKVVNLSHNQLFTITWALCNHCCNYYPDDHKFLRFFESYLYMLIRSGAEANIVLKVVEQNHLEKHIPWLTTELQRMTGGHEAWIKAAKALYTEDKGVARTLLDYYLNTNKQEFIHIARDLWFRELFRSELAEFYFNSLQPDDDPDFCREVTLYLNNLKYSTDYYRVLQSLMSKEERLAYMESFKWNVTAYTEALCLEEKYNEALAFAENHINRWNLPQLMAPLAQSTPYKAFEIMERKVHELLETERGRNFYERIVETLALLANIPGLKHKVELLAKELYTRYSRLSALRDELMKAEQKNIFRIE